MHCHNPPDALRNDPKSVIDDRPQPRAADALAEGLALLGVTRVFGMPGSHSTTVYDALSRRQEIQTVLIRNEQAGAFAADGYSRATARPGVICTTAGPGATNALTGLAEAWADSIPVLLLTGQVNADRMREECGAYHEIDLEGILRPVTKLVSTVARPDDLALGLSNAWRAMTTGRPRPAALVLPQDVMKLPASGPTTPNEASPVGPAAPDAAEISKAIALLDRAERPVILAGGGALWGGARDEVRALAELLGAIVVTSLNGKGLLDERLPNVLGHARSAGARMALPLADAMLAVGCRFTEVMTGWRTMPVPHGLIQVDIDPGQIGMNHPAAVGIVGDAKLSLRAILDGVRRRQRVGWRDVLPAAKSAGPTRPEWLIQALQAGLPDEAVVVTDACEMGYRMQTDWTVRGPRRFFYPSNYITLGWGLPAAIGAAVGLSGKAPVVSVSGDGGFLMTTQELATASRYALHVIAVVHNDNAYGAIKNIQGRDQGGRFHDVDLNNPDFVALARAFDVPACRADNPEAFRVALNHALDRPGPSLIEVPDSWRPIRAGA